MVKRRVTLRQETAKKNIDKKLLNLVPTLLFSLGFVLGMISDSNFPNIVAPHFRSTNALFCTVATIISPLPPVPLTPQPLHPAAYAIPTIASTYTIAAPTKNELGDVTLVAAECRLLANALLDLAIERFALLSESCIPICNFTRLYALLIGSSTSFIDSFGNHDSEGALQPQPRAVAQGLPMVRDGRRVHARGRLQRHLLPGVPRVLDVCAAVPVCLMDEHYIPKGAEVMEELVRIREDGGNRCFYNGASNGICNLFARKFAPGHARAPAPLGAQGTVMGLAFG
ncbi:hypothetical protein SETIT_5G091200v2 [Setaria italica]|uniref:Uncharacterized protein n=1 Tax=Setaria italica TaxID=4555 RepID=K3XQX3_SETIT|nr:hypothetical protein SETIT_5G091200v2 [Setaria italica]